MRAPWVLVLVAGCLGPFGASPGEPDVFMPATLVQGAPSAVSAHWGYDCERNEQWPCPSSTKTVMDVACSGCQVLEPATGFTGYSVPVMQAVATTDGPIKLSVTLRFDDTGEIRTVSRTATGDHEVALEATCGIIDTSVFGHLQPYEMIATYSLSPCGATREASETVMLIPTIRTLRGNVWFPFCLERPCGGQYGEPFRPLASLAIEPAPVAWWKTEQYYFRTDQFGAFALAQLPADLLDTRVSLSAALIDGTIATTSVAVPPVR